MAAPTESSPHLAALPDCRCVAASFLPSALQPGQAVTSRHGGEYRARRLERPAAPLQELSPHGCGVLHMRALQWYKRSLGWLDTRHGMNCRLGTRVCPIKWSQHMHPASLPMYVCIYSRRKAASIAGEVCHFRSGHSSFQFPIS